LEGLGFPSKVGGADVRYGRLSSACIATALAQVNTFRRVSGWTYMALGGGSPAAVFLGSGTTLSNPILVYHFTSPSDSALSQIPQTSKSSRARTTRNAISRRRPGPAPFMAGSLCLPIYPRCAIGILGGNPFVYFTSICAVTITDEQRV